MSGFLSAFHSEFASRVTLNGDDCVNTGDIADGAKFVLPVDSGCDFFKMVKTMNSEMITLGCPTILSIDKEQPVVLVDQLVRGALHLARSYIRNNSAREDLQYRLSSMEADLSQLRKLYDRSQNELAEARRTAAQNKERERRMEEEKKAITARGKATMDELRKIQLNFQRYETQSLHERRKLERELVALRERFNSFISKSAAPTSPRRRASSRPSSVVSLPTNEFTDHHANATLDAHRRKAVRRVAVVPNRTVPSHSQARSPTKFSGAQESACLPDDSPAMADFYNDFIRMLENKQHSLLYENRELRDLVSQLSSRLVRFTSFLERHRTIPATCEKSPNPVNRVSDEEFDSLEENDEESSLERIRPDSSDEEPPPRDPALHNVDSTPVRRRSAQVNQLLLELPYPLVRDHLIQRVRRLSRGLWRQLKLVVNSSLNQPDGARTATASALTSPSSTTNESATGPTEVDRLRNEVVTLTDLVANYESRVKEQQVALRNALFSNSRLCLRCSKQGPSEVNDRRSSDGSPQRRVSLFKVQKGGPVWLGNSELSLDRSTEAHLPVSGAGDQPNEISCPSEEIDSTPEMKPSSRYIVVLESPSIRRSSSMGSDAIRNIPACSTFTSSPFPARTQAVSVDFE